MSDELDLDALESLLAKATPGPWEAVPDASHVKAFTMQASGHFVFWAYAAPAKCSREGDYYECLPRTNAAHVRISEEDASLITTLRNVAPKLIEAARQFAAAKARIAALEAALKSFLHLLKPDADDVADGRKDALEGLPDSHCFELTWAPEEPGSYITAGQIRRAARLLKDTP